MKKIMAVSIMLILLVGIGSTQTLPAGFWRVITGDSIPITGHNVWMVTRTGSSSRTVPILGPIPAVRVFRGSALNPWDQVFHPTSHADDTLKSPLRNSDLRRISV